MQVTTTEEHRLYPDMTAEQYAEEVFNMMVTFPVKPLGQLLSAQQLQQLKASYMPEALPMAERMRTEGGDIDACFTIQWAVAKC